MEFYLGLEDLKECIDTDLPPEVIENPQSAEMKKDARARAKICLSIHTDLIRFVRSTKTAKQAWDSLSEVFEEKGVHRRIALLYELFDIKHENCGSLQKYTMEFKDMVTKIDETGKPVEEELAAALLLCNLKAEYKWHRQLIERTCTTKTGKAETLPFEVVVAELLKEAQKEVSENRRGTTSGPALKATGGTKNSNRRGQRDGGAENHPATRGL